MSKPPEGDKSHDKTLEDTFPASVAPANVGITGAEPPEPRLDSPNTDELPTGWPTSDRYATETASQAENEDKPLPKP